MEKQNWVSQLETLKEIYEMIDTEFDGDFYKADDYYKQLDNLLKIMLDELQIPEEVSVFEENAFSRDTFYDVMFNYIFSWNNKTAEEVYNTILVMKINEGLY
ncbi:MAG: hypothetical protein ACOC1O_06460 [bacterium]